MFASVTAKIVTAACAVVGAIALLETFFVTLTGGSPYVEFGLAVNFFTMFLVALTGGWCSGRDAACRSDTPVSGRSR